MIAAAIAFAILAAVLLFSSGWIMASSKAESRVSLANERATSLEAELESAKQVRTMLSPVLEREKLAADLSSLAADQKMLDLPSLLNAIAEVGSFAAIIVSDETGLPVATNASIATSPEGVDRLVGAASLVLMVADRADKLGEPRPLCFVVQDESNRMICYRLFDVDGTRFLLTAATRGRPLTPNSLDPVVGKLEASLSRHAHER
ncbi:MAG: hypothetical protein FWD69_03065 [Polyangiaceae bacterium]|nr:hypothetical protein [Polyangiaceae bacterium]